jgi:hypothetical protein
MRLPRFRLKPRFCGIFDNVVSGDEVEGSVLESLRRSE